MSASKNSNGLVKYAVIAAVLVICGLSWALIDALERVDIEKSKHDPNLYNNIKDVVSHISNELVVAKEKLKMSESARAVDRINAMQAEDAFKNIIKDLKRQLRAVNTSRATVPELDSMQRSLYGPAPNDSVHTIPLDYSRKLTGDALRLPIEQRMATMSAERLDSATAHYVRMEASYEIDIHDLKQTVESASQAVDSLGTIAGKMQGVIDTQERDFRRQRRKERIVEGLVFLVIIAVSI